MDGCTGMDSLGIRGFLEEMHGWLHWYRQFRH